VKVEYQFDNLPTYAAFDGYAWCSAALDGQGISWTNKLSATGASGYSVLGGPSVPPVALPGHTSAPTDPDHDGFYEDLNGNGIADFDDMNQFYAHLAWIQANEPVPRFDLAADGVIDLADVIRHFQEL
ncbi:MAG: PKD domain-containing protein, partial [Methanoregulaceae archaeon]|nr:PKD domain-containing protein [Methanoregulaceae archaeon]